MMRKRALLAAGAAVALASAAAAQNEPISGLQPRGTVQSTDLIPILPAGAPRMLYTTVGQLCSTGCGGGSGSVTSIVAGVGLTGGTITASGTIALANPSAVTLGGVESLAAAAHEWINQISTSGVPGATRPACGDLSDATFCNTSETNGVTLANLAQAAANTVLGNASGSTADVTAIAMPSCSGAAQALNWTSGTGPGCVTISGGGSGPTYSGYEIDYFYNPSELTKPTAGANSQTNLSGAGQGITDINGGVWSVTAQVLTGTTDTTNGTQFLRDWGLLPSASTPVGVNQAMVIDLDPADAANVFAVFRGGSGTSTGYFVGANNATGASKIMVYNSGSLVASATGSPSGFVSGHTLRVTAEVVGSSPTAISVAVVDRATGLTVSSTTLSDNTSGLQSGTVSSIAVGNNAGAATAQNGVIDQFVIYDPTVPIHPRYVAFIGDSITYGQQVSDAGTNGGTLVGDNPAAQAYAILGTLWGGVNLGNQAAQTFQLNGAIQQRLATLGNLRPVQWAVVMTSINDLGRGQTVAATEADILTMVANIHAAGFRVLLSTILPIGSGCTVYNAYGTTPAGINTNAATLNTWLRANWQTFADAFTDPANDSRLSAYSSTYWYSDELHLNNAGSAALGGIWAPDLSAAATPGLAIYNQGALTTSAARSLNFTGAGVTTTDNGLGGETVTIGGAPNALALISSVTTSGSQSTVSFTSIPGTYTDLILKVVGQASTSGGVRAVSVQFNGDTGNNYDWIYTGFTGTSTNVTTTSFNTNSVLVGAIPDTLLSGGQGQFTAEFDNYSGTTFKKSASGYTGVVAGTTAANAYGLTYGGDWHNTAAITSITVGLSSGNFVNGTIVALYGRN
jgi:hypothetical protein